MLRFHGDRWAPISADRTTRTLVENAGEPFPANAVSFGPWCRQGKRRVGRAYVTWFAGPEGRVGVGHAPPGAAFVADADALVYALNQTRTSTPTGGERAWWLCPSCDRRCAVLYLPDDRERLGCRACCRLVYASQYPPLKRKRRRKRG